MGATYSYSLTPDHYLAAMTLGTRQLYADPAVRRANRAYALTYMLAWFALWLAAMAPLEPAQGLGLLALVVGGLALTVFLARRSQQAAFRAVADGVLASGGEFTLEQDDDGLVFGHAQGTSRIAWSGVRGVLEGPGLLVIQLRNFSVLPVPHGAFPDAASRQAFQALVKQEVERSGGETKVAPVVAPRSLDSGEAAMTGAAEGPLHRELGAHLRRGLRLLFLLSPGEPAPRESWTFFILLALLSLAVPPLFALAQTGFQGEFQAYQLPTAVFHLPVFALAAWVLAALAGRVERTLDLLLALVAMAVPLDGLVGLAYAVYPEGWDAGGDWVYQAPHLWLALAATVAAARLLGLDAGRRLAALGLALGTVSLPLGAVYRDRALWEAPESRAEQAENERRWNALVNEDSFYRQPRLLDQALAGLQPGRPGMTELFFVGLAGDAGQDVFMKEVRVVADLFRERFGTEGHTLTLINNPDSVADSPIATATSLERALARVGQAHEPGGGHPLPLPEFPRRRGPSPGPGILAPAHQTPASRQFAGHAGPGGHPAPGGGWCRPAIPAASSMP